MSRTLAASAAVLKGEGVLGLARVLVWRARER